jgi:hypothetical protein
MIQRIHHERRAAAVVELAVLLPLLAFLFLVSFDYCRVFFYTQVVTSCARNGAAYASDPYMAAQSPYKNVDEAARGDADSGIASKLTVTSTSGTDSLGSYAEVQVSYPFTTITKYPGIPGVVTITRATRVRVAPTTPN